MAERQFGPYRLVRQVAVGGMAEIHLAKTKGIAGFEKYVALKMIHPNFAEDEQFIGMLIDEAKIAVQLNHGNIAQTFDLGRVGDTYYITMEYVDGADLYKILRRGSEMDVEMPLDICAFIAKEVASALDHAHRKRDHTGKPLGIVHRDVSPQNVLISYSGEVKLVDFGIAKATMKARQTAVGVIKGKYYYMSPEQAQGEKIDHRSDIFSAGIVLYEMIAGQMLYLEEDLQRLISLVRRADIPPISTLRKGVPPQLERIVMHALDKDRRTRYQSAADFATDLERFLHAYSPVFTATKVAGIVKQIIGDPLEVPNEVTVHEGANATHTLTQSDLILDKEELEQDANSVIFRISDLEIRPRRPTGEVRVTREAELEDFVPTPRVVPKKTPVGGTRQPTRGPRGANEETREVAQPAPSGTTDDSGLLEMGGGTTVDEPPTFGSGRTTIDPPAFGGRAFAAVDEGGEATMISDPPQHHDEHDEDGETIQNHPRTSEEEGVTVQRDFRDKRAPAPPALAAKIHAPAVSELRKPRVSRKTPQGGSQNVLQAIVGAKPTEPMPAPPRIADQNDDSGAMTLPQQPSPVAAMPPPPAYPPPYATYPPPQQQQPYAQPYPAPYPQPYPPQYPPQQVSPGAIYGLQPLGAPPPQAMTLTGQLRLFEADEMNPAYKVTGGPRWIKLAIAGLIAVSLAAGVTFFIIKSTRDTTPTVGSIRVESTPSGAEVVFDGTRLAGSTPMSVDSVPVGTRHEIKIELARHQSYVETVDVPKDGREIQVKAFLQALTGKIIVISHPDGAEIRIDGRLYGRAPMTIAGLEMGSSKVLELRLKDYQPYIKNLEWSPKGEISIDATLAR